MSPFTGIFFTAEKTHFSYTGEGVAGLFILHFFKINICDFIITAWLLLFSAGL
jgi:small neutral amino acid transporter SnatA (MarC family)